MLSCEHCEKTFKNQQGLSLHIYRMHKKTASKVSTSKKIGGVAAPTITFCPCCGTNIRLLIQALAAIGELQNE